MEDNSWNPDGVSGMHQHPNARLRRRDILTRSIYTIFRIREPGKWTLTIRELTVRTQPATRYVVITQEFVLWGTCSHSPQFLIGTNEHCRAGWWPMLMAIGNVVGVLASDRTRIFSIFASKLAFSLGAN